MITLHWVIDRSIDRSISTIPIISFWCQKHYHKAVAENWCCNILSNPLKQKAPPLSLSSNIVVNVVKNATLFAFYFCN